MSTPFTQYIKLYPEALKLVNECLNNTKLPILEQIALRFCHALEDNLLDLKQGNERVFLFDILAKATSEMFATIGTLRNGALIPAYHHTRSIIELYAALEHVYCVPAKRERKLKKYVEYKSVARYLHYRERKRLLSAGQITNQDFSDSCPITEEEFSELEKRVQDWNQIWKLENQDPEVIQYWHYPATIQGLFESSDMTKTFWTTYENLCHATHLSPLVLGLAAGHLLIGFPKKRERIRLQEDKLSNCLLHCSRSGDAAFLQSTVKAGAIEGVLDYSVNDLRN